MKKSKYTEAEIQQMRDWFAYDPETGQVTAKARRGTTMPGKPLGCFSGRYVVLSFNQRLVLAHRVAWLLHYGFMPDCDIDHINQDKHDNRIKNLRLASRSQNIINAGARRDNASGYRGVSFHKGAGRYMAQIGCTEGGVKFNRYLGLFDTAEEAAEAYAKAARAIYGEFAAEAA